MGANGVLTTAGMGFDDYLSVTVVVQQNSGGYSWDYPQRPKRTRRTIELPAREFSRSKIIDALVREDEELVAIIVSALSARS